MNGRGFVELFTQAGLVFFNNWWDAVPVNKTPLLGGVLLARQGGGPFKSQMFISMAFVFIGTKQHRTCRH
jgi:hypothetical protein